MSTSEVIVVGCGPVGLITALGLGRAGVQVTLVEAEAGPSKAPRALVYHWAVMKGLNELGLLGTVVSAGLVKHDYSMRVHRTGETVRWSIRELEGLVEYPFNVHLGQDVLTQIVLEQIRRLPNVQIRWNTRVERIVRNDNDVAVAVSGPDGEEILGADWLVAADGARSPVRNALGLSFDGMTWPKEMVATNIEADLDALGFDKATFMIDETYGAIIVKIDTAKKWRVTYCEPAGLDPAGIVDRMPAMFAQILPGLDGKYELLQHSPYRMHQRVAGSFRVNRVLLAGDAAHITNPVGGLGLTAGLFDAFVLYEALVAVIRKDKPESMLDKYARARKANFETYTSPRATLNNQLLFYTPPEQLEQEMALVRRLGSERQAVLDRTLFVGALETPSLVTGRQLNEVVGHAWQAA
jgi:3-(3-hydroxy-phenyl)propionate hydroxylase/6-hydroxy-3-succinoylpyridine 3-monooxygenase